MVCGSICKFFLLCAFVIQPYLFAKVPSSEVAATLAPYLMADDHPIKARLDALFAGARVTFNLRSLEKAGFNKARPRKFTKLIVTSHPSFPGYIFKIYLDVQRFHKNYPEHHFWLLRAMGAAKIGQLIVDNHLDGLFKVPKKWIYALPMRPKPPKNYYGKYYILVEEDMDILSEGENKALWAGDAVSHELLRGLYLILKEVGLSDCVKPDNIPFSRDGKVAFIDTQTCGERVPFREMLHFLSRDNQRYWKSLY